MAVFSTLAATAATAGATTAGATGATTGLAGAVGAAGTIAGIAGTGLSVMGQFQANAEAKKQAELAKTQMNLEANRQKRGIIRQAVMARSIALSNANAQGASESSGLAGGTAQITAEQGTSLTGVVHGQVLGNKMFASKGREAEAQTLSSIGSGLSSLGGALVENQERIARLGVYSVS